MRHPSRRQLSHAQYFMQDITHSVFLDAHYLGYLTHLKLAACHYEIMDFFTLTSVVADFGTLRPRRNSINQNLTVTIEGEESPYTLSKRFLISLRDFPLKNKNRITDRYCSLSIFVKSAGTSVSTCGQNKTTNPIRLRF